MKNYIIIILIILNISNQNNLKKQKIVQCKGSKNKFEYMRFLAKTELKLNLKNNNVNYSGNCYQNINAIFEENDKEFNLSFTLKDKEYYSCVELLLIFNYEYNDYSTSFFGFKKTFTIKKKNKKFNQNIRENGFKIFSLCEDFWHIIPNFIMSLKLFLGGLIYNPKIPFIGSHIPYYQEKANEEVLKKYGGIEYQKMKNPDNVDISKIQTGDILLVKRFDLLDTINQISTGDRVSHAGIFVRENDKLYIFEIHDSAFWPIHDFQKVEYSQWLKYSNNVDFNSVVLFLNEENRKKFNEKKAKKFIEEKIGTKFGRKQFFFGGFDHSTKNLPDIFDFDFILFIMQKFQHKKPEAIKDYFLDGFNERLGLKNKSLDEILSYAAHNNINMADVMAIPNKNDGENYICSGMTIKILEEGGLFEGINFSYNEVSPGDLSKLNIFNKKVIPECNNKPYCQLNGNKIIDLPDYSNIKPFNNMFESCESQAPLYIKNYPC